MTEKDRIYNALLATIKREAAGVERGAVLAAMSELEGMICSRSSREPIGAILDTLKERRPRE